MVNPDGDDGQVQGIAARAAPMRPDQMNAIVAAANEDNVAINELMASLDALNLTLDDPSDQCYPKVIDSLKGFRAVGVCAGHRHR